MRNYQATITVSIDIHSDGDEMVTHNFDVECYSSNNGEIDPTRYEESTSCKLITTPPDWMLPSIIAMIKDVARNKFTSDLEKYEI